MEVTKIHPVAMIPPRMTPEETAELIASIAEHGLQDPIRILPAGWCDAAGDWSGAIIDGVQRWWACLENCIDPVFEVFDPTLPLEDHVRDWSLTRRHLTKQQIAVTAASLSESKRLNGGKIDSRQSRAEEAGVSRGTMARADRVVRASPKLAREVVEGKTSLIEADELVAGIAPPEVAQPVMDRYGQHIPKEIQHCFTKEYTQFARRCSAYTMRVAMNFKEMCGTIEEATGTHPTAISIDKITVWNAIVALQDAFAKKYWRPYCVCPVCGGDSVVLGAECGGVRSYCRRQGWVTKHLLTLIPRELRGATGFSGKSNRIAAPEAGE